MIDEPRLRHPRQYATLKDLAGASHVRWSGGAWHRVASWRGLRASPGITDDLRAARTECAAFVPSEAETSSSPTGILCAGCLRSSR